MTIDEGRLQTEVNAAQAAEAELRLTSSAFEKIRIGYIGLWKATNAGDERSREKLWMAIKVADEVEQVLKSTVTTGKLATAELERLHKVAERKRRFLRG